MKAVGSVQKGIASICLVYLVLGPFAARGILPPSRQPLPNFDQRTNAFAANAVAGANRAPALARLKSMVPSAQVNFDDLLNTPNWVSSPFGFLTGVSGQGPGISQASLAGIPAYDTNRVTKAFLLEHRELFGHGPEVLDTATVRRDFITAHNGLHTMVWEQQVDNIPVYGGLLISHTTKDGELVNISSHMLANPVQAATAGTPNRASLQAAPATTALQALIAAAENIGEYLPEAGVVTTNTPDTADAVKRQTFTAPSLKGEAEVRLIWLPMSASSLRLCWDVVLMSRARGEMFRVLIDVQTGRPLLRNCLTEYITNATFRVYTSDSPSPFSPGHPTPLTNQPPVTNRVLIVTNAFNTNASPNGWIDEAVNETRGNNVDAHTDHSGLNTIDPRPQGSPFRVFDFPMDLTQDPLNYSDAAVVQLFFLCNWYHDKLYELGFTEAAGNFQVNNFGRGGLGNDAVIADAQDGGGLNNANFSTPGDGSSGRMQMYIWSGPSPRRDGDFDAEIVFHEHTHGLSNRRVGGGVGLSALQSTGMGEGWSDFYGLSLLSEPGDDVNGNYAAGGYATYLLSGLTQNYYFGIRRYPYTTDMTKNPLTFKDIDPGQASAHPGIPASPVVGGGGASEVHNQGEVWCVTLWEARAQLVNKYGFAGNQLMLQLVTDGMNLSPANPTFLQARNAIIQADIVDNGGANTNELWIAFAKRGMGFSATSPASSTTTGVHEAFDTPFLPLTLFIPGSATEGDGVLVGQGLVQISAPVSNNVIVSLVSSNVNEVTVPPTVTILAGQTNASFNLTIVDDAILDGTQTTRITASAPTYATSSADLAVADNETAVLTVQVPNTATEGDAPVSATVKVSALPGANIKVTLNSSNPNELQVPAFVTIPSGQTTAVFNVTVVDDTRIDGDQTTTITAHVANWTDGVASMTIHDNESTNIVIGLPVAATEGDGVLVNGGSVSISGTLPTNLTVNLQSDDLTELTVPASATILAGQTTAFFNPTVVDDNLVDGAQVVHVTASAAGFSNGVATMTIFDDESPPVPGSPVPVDLATNVPANTSLAWNVRPTGLVSNGGFETGSFGGWSKQNTGAGDWAINNGTYVPTGGEAATPPFSGGFSVLSDQQGPGSHALYQDIKLPGAAISAVLGWTDRIRNFANQFATNQYFRVEIRDTNDNLLQVAFTTNPGDPLLNGWVTRSFDLAAYIGQTIRIAFVEVDNLNYFNVHLDNVNLQVVVPGSVTNDVYIGTNPTPGPAEFAGSTTNEFWNLPLLAPATTYYWQIVAHKVGTTASPVWRFTTRGANHFEWSPIAPFEHVGEAFGVAVTAKDEFNTVVSNFNGPVKLSIVGSGNAGVVEDFETGIWPHSPWVFISPGTPGTLSPGFAHDGTYGLGDPEWTYRTDVSVGADPGDELSWWIRTPSNPGVGRAYFGFGASAAGCWSIVTAANTSEFTLQRNNSFTFNTIVTKSQTYQLSHWYKVSVQFASTNSVVCNLFDSDGTTLLNTLSNSTITGVPGGVAMRSFNGFALDTIARGGGPPIAFTPTNSGNFSNGSWSGNFTVLQLATNISTRADDGSGHSGVSNPFNVTAGNDVALLMTDSPDPVLAGANLTYTLTVTNIGSNSATGVVISNTLPVGVVFSSAVSSQGTCTQAAGIVTCNLGAIGGSGSATVTIVVVPIAGTGSVTNKATVYRGEADPNPSNNSAVVVTAVVTPVLTINDVSLLEGNSGTTGAVFSVTLTPGGPSTVGVDFATADGTAVAGSDYVSTSGHLTFAGGQTNQTITVLVKGDNSSEPDETFFVNLTNASNAIIGDAQGVGTILSDDVPGGAYVRSTVGSPWGQTVNETAMNRVYGTNNWRDLRYETVTAGQLLTPATTFIYMEGSDFNATELEAFIATNLTAIQTWVSNGGNLFLDAAPNEDDGMNFGFGVTLTYPAFCTAAAAVSPGHPIFNSPFLPVGTNWTGDSFAHGSVSGAGLTALITNSQNGNAVVGEISYGAGRVIFGGMTTDNWQSPQPQAANLRANIIAYLRPRPVLIATLNGGQLKLTWEGSYYVLQSGTNINGPFTDIPAAASPYNYNATSGPRAFFRLRQ
jgi:uncharacterized repeat protein (TIGR01451 family)